MGQINSLGIVIARRQKPLRAKPPETSEEAEAKMHRATKRKPRKDKVEPSSYAGHLL